MILKGKLTASKTIKSGIYPRGPKGEKGDKGDCNFATFEINFKTGQLEMAKSDNLKDIDFTIENGNLEVEING